MVSKKRSDRPVCSQTRRFIIPVVAGSAVLAACSADFSRLNFDDSPTTGALPPTPPESVYSGPSNLGKTSGDNTFASSNSAPGPNAYGQPYGSSGQPYGSTGYGSSSGAQVPPLQTAARQPETLRPVAAEPTVMNANPASSYADNRSASSYDPPQNSDPESSGQTVVVERGDTLYGLSRRHGVKLNDLMAVNGLSTSALRPGQKLVLPANAATPVQGRSTVLAAATPVDAPAHWSDSYTVQPGDSLYALARRYNVKTRDMKQYNGITNPRLLKPGMVLKVPGPGGQEGTLAARETAPTTIPARRVTSQTITTTEPNVLNGPAKETRVAAVNPSDKTSDAVPQQSVTVTAAEMQGASPKKLRWPVRGRVITAFGKRDDGTHNDGINVAVPLGTNVHAVESGMVAYAGDELKGYGNLVLIRHDNGWVTAYAHADKLLVKRGDRVRRGDVIAKAGKTGDVALPQLHFELRQGQTPVDPIPYLEQL